MDGQKSAELSYRSHSAVIYSLFFSFCSWKEANHIVKAFKNTNQKGSWVQALSRCYSPTVYFQESLGNHCDFHSGFSEKPSVWSGTSDLYLPLAKGKQSPVSVLKPRLTSGCPGPAASLSPLACLLCEAMVPGPAGAVALQTGGDGVSLSLFLRYHPSFEWKFKCHFTVKRVTSCHRSLGHVVTSTRRPLREVG